MYPPFRLPVVLLSTEPYCNDPALKIEITENYKRLRIGVYAYTYEYIYYK